MKSILCIGTLIADVISQKLEAIPEAGQSVSADVLLCPGGSGYSSSVNIKRLIGKSVGVHCYGLIGDDLLGEIFEKELNKEGVISHLSIVDKEKTSCNIIVQQQGVERRYIFCEGANSHAQKSGALEVVRKVQPDVLVLGEMPSLRLVASDLLEIIKYAKNSNSIVCLDALTDKDDYVCLNDNWHLIDILHCNREEGVRITNKEHLSEMCYWFLENGVALPVVSDGEKGCVYGYESETYHIAAFEVEEVDPTGAGDALLAGIVFRLIQLLDEGREVRTLGQETVEKLCVYGAACGALAVGSLGCVSDISAEKVQEILNRQMSLN